MRLIPYEIKSIIESAKKILLGYFSIYLFGSRVNDQKRGGDIDLLILSDCPVELKKIRMFKIILKEEIENQKIDVVYDTYDSKNSFVELVREEGVKLWEVKKND